MISMDTLFTFQQVSADPYDWIFFALKGKPLEQHSKYQHLLFWIIIIAIVFQQNATFLKEHIRGDPTTNSWRSE